MSIVTCEFESHPLHINYAEIAQLVEHNLAKVGVASSSLVFRSSLFRRFFFIPFVKNTFNEFIFKIFRQGDTCQ